MPAIDYTPTSRDDPEAVEELASLLSEIYDARSDRWWTEAVLATAAVIGEGPKACQTRVIERELNRSTKREVALTKMAGADGLFNVEREPYQSPIFETGRTPVQAAQLCNELGLSYDEAAAAVSEADGPPEGTPWAGSETWQPGVAKELRRRLRGDGEKQREAGAETGDAETANNGGAEAETQSDFTRDAHARQTKPAAETGQRRRTNPTRGADRREEPRGRKGRRREDPRGTGGIGEGVVAPSNGLESTAICLSEAQNPDLEASEVDNSHVCFGLLDRIGHVFSGRLDSESEEGGSGDRSSRSYLVTEMIGNYKQRDLLNEAVEKAPEEIQRQYRHAAIHLLHSAEIYSLHDYHRIHHETWIEELQGGWTLDEIEGGTSRLWDFEGSIIEPLDDGRYHSGGDGQRGLTREYRIKTEFALRFQSIAEDADPNYKLHHENKRQQGKAALDSRLRDPSGHRWGKKQDLPGDAHSLVDGALRVLDDAEHRIRIRPIKQAKDGYEEAAERARERHEEKGTEETEKMKEKAEGRLHALSAALDIIERQTDRIEDGIAYIQNAYEVQSISGRFSFRRGGPLGLPGVVKAIAYDLPNVHNWDIKSSQTVGLRQLATELQELGREVSTAPLDDYLDKGGKDWACKEYDLPRTLVKRVEHAVKFGGVIPDSMAQARHLKRETGHMPQIAGHVEEFYFTEAARDEALQKLQAVFGPQGEMIQSLAEGLLEEYWDAHKQRGGRGKGWVMRNHCGITFCLYDYEEGHVRRSKAMAWYLQGLEASYVHAITILSQKHDYEVMANEHDGLITIGRVPDEAKERARELSGSRRAELVEKPFEDEEEVRALCDRIGIDPPQHFEDQPCKSSQNVSRKDEESAETPGKERSTSPRGREDRSSAKTPATSSSSTWKRQKRVENDGAIPSASTSRRGTPAEDRKSTPSKRSGEPTTTSTSSQGKRHPGTTRRRGPSEEEMQKRGERGRELMRKHSDRDTSPKRRERGLPTAD